MTTFTISFILMFNIAYRIVVQRKTKNNCKKYICKKSIAKKYTHKMVSLCVYDCDSCTCAIFFLFILPCKLMNTILLHAWDISFLSILSSHKWNCKILNTQLHQVTISIAFTRCISGYVFTLIFVRFFSRMLFGLHINQVIKITRHTKLWSKQGWTK